MNPIKIPSGKRPSARSLASSLEAGRGFGRRLFVEAGLWQFVVLTFFLDVVSTYQGLQLGFIESNPLMHAAFGTFGFGVIWPAKAVPLGLALVGWASLPATDRSLVPVALGLPWVVAVLLNTSHLAGV